MNTCYAVQQSDEMFCPNCVLRWDVNDSDPPRCLKPRHIVGISGPAGSGKTTMGDHLRDRGFYRVKMAAPLKAMVQALLIEMGHANISRAIEGDLKETPLPFVGETPRRIMQTLGTDWGREMISETLWTDIALARIKTLPRDTNVVIDDIRFENEAQMVRSLGGKIIQITGRGGISGSHVSERGVQADMSYYNTLTIKHMRGWLDYHFP